MLLAAFLCSHLFGPEISLDVDAREAGYGLVHTHETLAVQPGNITLSYPKWHPGNHRPTGPINDMLNLKFSINGRTIPWKRDPVELYRFNLTIPQGASELEITFDDAAEAGTTFTPHLARLEWNRFLLYPTGKASDSIQVQAQVTLPAEWTLATPLLKEPTGGNRIPLRTVSLTEFVDSPGLAGKNFRRVDLSNSEAIDIVGETPASLGITPETTAATMRLVAEANALFGAKHYRHYDFLVSVSNLGGFMGLEHHECSEDGSGLDTFTSASGPLGYGELVAHEYAHSWNGKYRRPFGLATPTYDEPMKGDLLWVYEGMTQFWGEVLAARSGLATQEEFRQDLANYAATLSLGGRDWRPVEDTAVSVSVLRGTSRTWGATRRGLDYYDEAVFTWLEVDSIIRKLTNDKKSIDDFCKLFHGGKSGPPTVKTYTFEDVVSSLNAVAPYDWATLLRTRIYALQSSLSLSGVESEGWQLVWSESTLMPGRMKFRGNGAFYTLGASISPDGTVTDVILAMPAGVAGLRPGMKIKSVNGEKYSDASLLTAIQSKKELDLGIEYGGESSNVHIAYSGGLKVPHLERIPSVPDQLSELAKPHAG